ncbi:MAG: hypothetical protein JWO26_2270 [Rhodospirillales bacterium]|nr:hypothetical protein [Rhodospirillales bacterium]
MSDPRGFLDGPDDSVPSPAQHPAATAAAAAPHGVVGFIGDDMEAGPISLPTIGTLPVAPPGTLSSTPFVVAATAIAVLGLALVLLSLGNFVTDQFARSAPLGVLTLAILLSAGGALGWAAWREWRGLAQLRSIDAIRADLAGEDVEKARAAALLWLKGVGMSEEQAEALGSARTTAAIRGMLKMALVRFDAAAAASGRSAALQVLTATAISPWPGLDGLIVVWRGSKLVRQVASLYGFRPGALGTLSLFRRVAIDAGTVAAADIAVGAMVESFAHDAVLSRLLGQAAGAATATRRMLRLARAVADACRPLPRVG